MASNDRKIGVAITGQDTNEVLARIQHAEALWIQAAWMTTGGAGRDGITVFAATAARTERILLGTSIMPTCPGIPWRRPSRRGSWRSWRRAVSVWGSVPATGLAWSD